LKRIYHVGRNIERAFKLALRKNSKEKSKKEKTRTSLLLYIGIRKTENEKKKTEILG